MGVGRTVVAVGLLAVGCTAGGAPDPAGPRDPATPVAAPTPDPVPVEAPEGVYRLQGCEPRSLLPASADEACGAQVVDGLFSQLVTLADDGTATWGAAAPGAVAAEVDSLDGRRWVIELKPDWRFHDGTELTASSFVDAWNLAARATSGQASSHLFEPILGFDDVNCPQPGCEPVSQTMTGLTALDERTVEVVLREADRLFPRRLAHQAYSPLPASAFEDLEAYGEAPVGNGPLRLEGAWEHDRLIALRPVEDHPAPAAAGVDVLLGIDPEAVPRHLQEGRLDVATAVPADRRDLVRDAYTQVERVGGDYDFLVVPDFLPAYEDNRLAVALSRAINRRAVIDEVLAGSAEPAEGVVPAAIFDGLDRCGARCRFDPGVARSLLERASFPEGGLRVWVDGDATHQAWVRAVVGQWRRHLGLEEDQLRMVTLPHASWVSHLQDHRVTGLYPLGWTLDVASPATYLRQLHGPGGLFNFDDYRGDGVGRAIDTALAADTVGEAEQQLADVAQGVVDDMHHIPLWVHTHEAWFGDRVADLSLTVTGRVDLAEVELSS